MTRREINTILDKYQRDASSVLAILQDIQHKERYLPREALEQVASQLDIPLSKLFYLATFYRAFSLEPRGKHLISVCLGTACHVRGAQKLVERLESKLGIGAGGTTEDRAFSLDTVNCLGACALGPVVVIDGKYHGQMKAEEVEDILAEYGRNSGRGRAVSARAKAERGPERASTKKDTKRKKLKGK